MNDDYYRLLSFTILYSSKFTPPSYYRQCVCILTSSGMLEISRWGGLFGLIVHIYTQYIDKAGFQKMCLFKVLKANRVNLLHTCFLGVLRPAESKSAVCRAQKWPLSPQNGTFKDGGHYHAFRQFFSSLLSLAPQLFRKLKFWCAQVQP